MLKNESFLKWCLVIGFLSLITLCSSCILSLIDSSNFGDENKLQRIMLGETWQVERMHAESAERADRSEPFTITLDSVLATSGTMYFAKDSERGRRDIIYTDANGTVIEGAIIFDSDVNNDNPMIEFDTQPLLFPEPYKTFWKFDVPFFDDDRIELLCVFYGTGDRTRYQYTIDLVK